MSLGRSFKARSNCINGSLLRRKIVSKDLENNDD